MQTGNHKEYSRSPALPCGSFEAKRPIVNQGAPRMDTKRHKDRWTSFNHKRHKNASANLFPWCEFVSLVDNPLDWFQTSPASALRVWLDPWPALGEVPLLDLVYATDPLGLSTLRPPDPPPSLGPGNAPSRPSDIIGYL